MTAREHGGVWSDYTFATTGHAEHDPVINLRSGPTGIRRQAISEGSVRQGAREVVHTPVSFGLGNDPQDFIRSEIALFDRSWYNRAGVERVMGFCTEDEYIEFLRSCPEF